ncbi:amino acid ABC transporter [Clostridiales bacterium COT073_COT-073]|nr:amino acid ABC transporter [Clostridiales bacterium COT073_COT-073]
MALVLVLSLAACAGDTAKTETKKEETPKEESKKEDTPKEDTKKEETKVAKTSIDMIKEKGVLVMGTCADYPPYETHALINGKDEIVGFDIEIGKEIAKALGVELKIEDMDFDALLVSLNNEKVDLVIAGMSATEERAKSVDFSMVYYNPSQKIVVRKADVDSLTTLDAFKGKTIGVQKGTIQEEFADEYMQDATKVALGKIPALILELKSGKSDGLVLEEPVSAAYVSKNPDLVISKVDIDIEDDGGSSVAIKKGNKELLDVVNSTIQKLIDEKKIDEMVVEANKLMEQE